MLTKSKLAIMLSKLKSFPSPDLLLEQYATDSEIAAEVLWMAYMNGDIEGKIVADLGCGPGIFGIGCLLLGAKKVYFVDRDDEALSIAAENVSDLKLKGHEMVKSDINDVNLKADVVLQNPPFGTKKRHADRAFLIKAFETAPIVYSIHKSSTMDFVQKLGSDHGFKVSNIVRYSMPIKHSHSFHKRRIHRIDAACFRLEKL